MLFFLLFSSTNIIKVLLGLAYISSKKGGCVKKEIMLPIVFYLLFICNSLSFAARPLATDDAGVVDKGRIEIETGLEYINLSDKELGLSLCIKRGMFNNLDLGIEFPYKFINFVEGAKTDGFDDITLTSKYNFLKENDVFPAASVSLSLKTDSGNNDKSLGTGKREYAVNAIMSKSLNSMAIHFNIGYSVKDDLPDDNSRDVLTYGLAVEFPLSEKVNLVGEISGENERRYDFDDNSMSGLTGFNYSFNEIMTYDLGFAFEISEASPDFKITTGLTFSL